MKVLLAVLLAALMVCVPGLVVGAPDLKLIMVQVLHRHGARTAEVSYNRTLICGTTPCGYLTWPAFEMVNNTAAFLRARYNTDPDVVTEPMFPSPNYDLDVVYSRSTDVLRTLQSAEAFLRGFFPNLTSLYPAIHTMPERDDYLLYTNYAPQFQFYYNLDYAGLLSVCNPATDKNFPDFSTLTEIGKEVHSETYCSRYDRRCNCAFSLFDIAMQVEAMGELSQYPLLMANRDALADIARTHYTRQYMYNRSNMRSFLQGSSGQPILQQFVANINTAIAATLANTSSYKLYHYSAHDTTLIRIALSLQDTANDGLLAPFSQALVLELLQNETDQTFHVRVLRGHPGQSPDTGFEFAWESDWQLQCMDAWQTAYNATNNTCPVADFARFVQWSAPPPTSKGLCYLDERYQGLMNCPAGGIQAGEAHQTLNSACRYYRTRCPSYSCSPGYLLDSVTLQCVCVGASCNAAATGAEVAAGATGAAGLLNRIGAEDDEQTAPLPSSGMSSAGVAAVALGSLSVGVLIAAFATSAVCLLSRRTPYTKVAGA